MGFAGLPAAPFVAGTSATGTTGGVKDFWLTVKGTAGATLLDLGPGPAVFVRAVSEAVLGAGGGLAAT